MGGRVTQGKKEVATVGLERKLKLDHVAPWRPGRL